MQIGQGVENKWYLLNTIQIIQNRNYTGLCLLVTTCHINDCFMPLAWRAELSWEAAFIKLICRKMTTSSPSDTSVLATNMLNLMVFGGGWHVGPGGFFGVQCLVYGFDLNLLCGHARRQESLSLWGCCFCSLLMLCERSGLNLLQNFFCCEKTTVCQTWNSMQMCIGFSYSQRDLGGKRRDLSHNRHLDFQELKNLLCEYSSKAQVTACPRNVIFLHIENKNIFSGWGEFSLCSEHLASVSKSKFQGKTHSGVGRRGSKWLAGTWLLSVAPSPSAAPCTPCSLTLTRSKVLK